MLLELVDRLTVLRISLNRTLQMNRSRDQRTDLTVIIIPPLLPLRSSWNCNIMHETEATNSACHLDVKLRCRWQELNDLQTR